MMSDRTGNYTKKLQVYVDQELYDMCKELVDAGGAYRSVAELVRDGMQMAFDKNSGYLDNVNREIERKYAEDETMRTRIRIDGELIGLAVNARWFAKHGSDKMQGLIDDLHVPGPIEDIERKYGTKIELYDLALSAPTSGISPESDEAYKQTYAYRYEHGLLTQDELDEKEWYDK